jgi:murein DD-endopeptidase MepM/ murein hydrolase activator NlpD
MFERQNNRLAASLLFAGALALSGCATPDTDLGWPAITYHDVTVHSGDSLSAIADRNNVPENTLIALNGISNPNQIYPGQVLRVPDVANKPERVAERETAPASHTPVPKPAPRYTITKTDIAPRTPDPSDGSVAFIWPVEGHIISPFGATDSGERNDGINISATLGEPIHAAAAGIVTYAGDELKGYGNLVLIRHDDGYVTAYAHAESITVSRGERVVKGQVIGYAGDTGDVKTPQLHFEIRKGVEPVDPKPLLVASSY